MGVVWPFYELYIPVFGWQVTGTWRSARRALRALRCPGIERRYDRLANFAAATSLVRGGTAIATTLIPVRGEHSAVDVAGVVAFAFGMSALLAMAIRGVIRVVGKLIAADRED
jgi:hypothetical protein